MSSQRTLGRAETFRTRYEKAPTTPYSLEELIHLASVTIANLPVGHCIVKIGSRPAVRVRTLRVRRRLISPEHYGRAMGEIAAATPYVTTREEAAEAYRRFRAALARRIAERDGDDED